MKEILIENANIRIKNGEVNIFGVDKKEFLSIPEEYHEKEGKTEWKKYGGVTFFLK